jgi:hypothetical protein
MTPRDDPKDVHMSPDEIRTAVEEANRLGKPVMAHAHAAQGKLLNTLCYTFKIYLKRHCSSVESWCSKHRTWKLYWWWRYLSHQKEVFWSTLLKFCRGGFLVPTLYIGKYFLERSPGGDMEKNVQLTRL